MGKTTIKGAKKGQNNPITYNRTGFSDAKLLDLYREILFPRMIEEKMLVLLRQNRISKWFAGIGQEAIAVGSTLALNETDYILPMHRNLGVFTARHIPFERLFGQWQGKANGFTQGRDRSFHFGTSDYRIIGMISHLGANWPVADGIGLASNLDKDDVIALAYSGEGGTSEGEVHEAMNVASVWDLPVIFLVENNGYGLSTPSTEQYRCKDLVDRAAGYGMKGFQIDGNNLLEVYTTFAKIAKQMRKDRKPVFVEAMTFRMRGHEEASGTKYVPQELFDEWAKKDPVENFERFLLNEGVLTAEKITEIREEFKQHIQKGLDDAFEQPEVEVDAAKELRDIFVPANPEMVAPDPTAQKELRFVDAIREGLQQAMERDPELVIMGQDVAEYGGVFKVTDGFMHQFGKDRVRNTPICEAAIIGAGLGLSIRGRASVVEMQFADFVSCGFNQIVNNLAKTHYRWGQPVRVTVRMPCGGGMAAGPFHSQSNEAWFAKVAGLKIVYPSNPFDAKGLLTTSIQDPNPVIFFEHKFLYRSVSEMVPEAYYSLPLGKAAVTKPGTDLTIVTYGWGVQQALAAAEKIKESADIEVIDLRTLIPWDQETVFDSVKKTGKCLVLHEDTLTLGIGAEIAATVAENCFQYLDGPVKRVASLDTPIPFHKQLEAQFFPWGRIDQALEDLLGF